MDKSAREERVEDHMLLNLNGDECNPNRLVKVNAKSLSIKTGTCSSSNLPHFTTCTNTKTTAMAEESSTYSSPSLISPPSSAFVSAHQSPYISPRALTPNEQEHTPPASDMDIPSSSYARAPERERSDYSDDGKLKYVAEPTPRISFSFPVPRLSLAKASVCPALNAKLRSCDVFVGYHIHGHSTNLNLVRYCKWLKSELELQGIACFLADRARYADSQSHEIADRVICSVSFGIVVISNASLNNHFSMEEVRFFTQKKNLIPMFFDSEPMEIAGRLNCRSIDKQCREVIEGLLKYHHELNLEAKDGDWRSSIHKAAGILRSKLGRQSITAKELERGAVAVELPFPRNSKFLGRHKEMMEMEAAFFGNGVPLSLSAPVNKASTSSQSEGFADEEETDRDESSTTTAGKYISLGMAVNTTRCVSAESQFEDVESRHSLKRPKYKKSKSGKDNNPSSSVICISGPPGVGKTELALEFAYKYSHRYKMVFWVGGETRYLRQNIINLSADLGLDVSADPDKERGRIRNFEQQEYEAFKRIKRELFRDIPYLIIIDNLETENEWWEGKDLHELIPRTTGGTHVIITTRLSKVMNIDVMQLETLPYADAMLLFIERRNKEYPAEEYEYLKKFEEKLSRSTFGLRVVDSLLTELAIPPSALFEVVQQASFEDMSSSASAFSSISEKLLCQNNPFLMKILGFCFSILEKATTKKNCLAFRMLLVGAWFAPSPIPANLLHTAAKHIPATQSRLKKWSKFLNPASCCCSCPIVAQTWKRSEEEYALLLVRLGLARRVMCQPGVWIQFHPITRMFARARIRTREAAAAIQATVVTIMKMGKPLLNSEHLWASAFLVFGFKSEPPLVQLKPVDMVQFIKKTAIPLAIGAFTTFSRCNSALELLKVSTGVLEDVEKSFVSQIQDWHHASLCWNKKMQRSDQKVDEFTWEEVTLLKATLLETRAKLLLRGGYFDTAEELCRTCISIRTVMLGHNHSQTLAAQETLAKLVRLRSKI